LKPVGATAARQRLSEGKGKARQVARGADAKSASAPAGGKLVVCPTPIGNLDDISLRVLDALRTADVVACEDTRHTGRLLKRHGVAARLISYHEHNERRRATQLLERIAAGEIVALVSDSGTPAISDPGFALVRACIDAGLAVEVLPGPAAPVTALVASGLPADRWRFVGFLPRRKTELRRELERSEETLIAFESPQRLVATLALLADLDPERPVAVCRELTKLHEEVVRGSAAEVAKKFASGARGEIVLVIGAGGTAPKESEVNAALDAVEHLVEAGARRRAAAQILSSLTGLPANRLYRPR
jgi:16S rRNA (cytidine1402-2'-O)-methyltransferase